MPGRLRKAVSLTGALLAVIMLCTTCTTTEAKRVDSTGESIWSADTVPTILDDPDSRSIELGTEFTPASDGFITTARIYQGPADPGPLKATLWMSSDGRPLATVSIPPGPTGWREVRFGDPVRVSADERYIISYRAPRGRYANSADTFALGRTVKSGWLTALGSVFTYGDGFPDQPSKANYYVDVVFEPAGPKVRPVDGGDGYYNRFMNSLPGSPDFFPLAVWYTRTTSPEEVAADRALGLNTYLVLSEDSNLQAIRDGGMYAITERLNPLAAGLFTVDEADMWAGAGDAEWNGEKSFDSPATNCIPEGADCGYTVMMKATSDLPKGIMRYTNYGKGVMFWNDRDQAERFVNDYQDVVSVDNYWFADDAICQAVEGGVRKTAGEAAITDAECHLAANYGMTTRYLRSLVQPKGAIPVWNFVELGYVSPEGSAHPITGTQLRAAVWSSIIAGARGIAYFAHNFDGPCPSYNVLRDHCGDAIRGDLAAINQQISRLAPVLNAPFVDGYARSDGPVDLAVKWYDGSYYLLVGSTQNEPADVTIQLACGSADTAEVIDEGRTVQIAHGAFRDNFADGNAVHLYRIGATDGCRPT